MKFYSDAGNFQSLKVFITLSKLSNEKGIKRLNVEICNVKHSDCVLPFNHKSKLPVLEINEGSFIFSPNTSAKYLYLSAVGLQDEDRENEFLDWEASELLPKVAAYLVSTVGHSKKDKSLEDAVGKVLKELDNKFTGSKFLLGNTISVSDICIYSTIFPLLGLKNFGALDSLSKVKQWIDAVGSDQSVKSAIDTFTAGKGTEIFKSSLVTQSFPLYGQSSTTFSDGAKPVTQQQQPVEPQAIDEKVPQEELDAAVKNWCLDFKSRKQPRTRKHPILPKENERNLLVMSALPYVNNVPHLGNIIGCVLSADVYSRFARLRNHNVLFICGTDEYGTATETKAMEEGVTPQEICDRYNKLHTQIYDWFNIDFDYFGRTTTPQQTQISQDIFWKLHKKGHILKDSVDQLQCTKCVKFLADRFVEGTCPLCGFDDARGDQCDGCGKLINAVELKDPKCKICKSSPVIKTSQHLFLDLPKLEPQLKAHLDKVTKDGTWTNNAKVITNSWLRDGLKPRCISRDLKWGTPIPLDGYTDKVFYVWFDAPIGYISITANYTDQWESWWKNDSQVELYHFLGKDNVPFHSVIFPSCLIGADDNWSLLNHIVATEYLNYEDGKFSKSRGTGVFGDQAKTTGIPADIYRFYLLYLRPETQDTIFSWDDFHLKNNGEMLNNLGNFINRALSFLSNTFGGVVQEINLIEEDQTLLALVTRELKTYVDNLENCKLRDGIRNILSISKLGNQFMQSSKPWVLAKGSEEDRKRAGSVVSMCANISCLLSVLLQPYMPQVSATIQSQLAAPPSVNVITEQFSLLLPAGHKIGKPSPLFQKIEASTITELKEKFKGKQAETKKVGGKTKAAGGDVVNPGVKASPEEIQKLTDAVSNQGIKVRELKTAKAEKAVVDAEVAILLQLKKDLAAAQGEEPKQGSSGKKKKGSNQNEGQKKEKSAKPSGDNSQTKSEKSSPEAEKLAKAVADQANKVRELKIAKVEKSQIDAEVATLLNLKKDLALAQGLDPTAYTGDGKKKGKK